MKLRDFIAVAVLTCIPVQVLTSCAVAGGDDHVTAIPVQLTEDGAWTFINAKGEPVGSQTWEFEPSMAINDFFVARNDTALIVYRWDGDQARPVEGLDNLVSAGCLSEGLIPVAKKMERIQIVNGGGKVQFTLDPIDGKEIEYCDGRFHEGMLKILNSDHKAGIVDRKGNVVFAPKYDDISNFSDGYALATLYDSESEVLKLYILDRKGNETRVHGQFSYGMEEGECGSELPMFMNGAVTMPGQINPETYMCPIMEISTDGSAKQLCDADTYYSVQTLPDGATITTISGDKNGQWESTSTWKNARGETVMKTIEENMTSVGNMVALSDYNANCTRLYNEKGVLIRSFDSSSINFTKLDKFGIAMSDYSGERTTYSLLDPTGAKVNTPEIYGMNFTPYVELAPTDEIDCGFSYVSSGYVDATAAANKILAMVESNTVPGKENYYIGEEASRILAGTDMYIDGSSRSFPIIAKKDSYEIGSGAGFTISGECYYSSTIGLPGTNVFNPSARVEYFEVKVRANAPCGDMLRHAIGRQLKKQGLARIGGNAVYDEYSNGYNNAIVYGTNISCGVGVIFGNYNNYYTPGKKNSLSAAYYI